MPKNLYLKHDRLTKSERDNLKRLALQRLDASLKLQLRSTFEYLNDDFDDDGTEVIAEYSAIAALHNKSELT